MNKFKEDIDPFDEEDWNEIENDYSFLWWLKQNYPNQDTWKNISIINCYHNQLTDLNGIEKLTNLKKLYCYSNFLTNLNEIKNLTYLTHLNCFNNKLINLNGIENLFFLQKLTCYKNQLENLNEIKKLTKNFKLF
jgi:Leucine-rich repeat (LRR) protein